MKEWLVTIFLPTTVLNFLPPLMGERSYERARKFGLKIDPSYDRMLPPQATNSL